MEQGERMDQQWTLSSLAAGNKWGARAPRAARYAHIGNPLQEGATGAVKVNMMIEKTAADNDLKNTVENAAKMYLQQSYARAYKQHHKDNPLRSEQPASANTEAGRALMRAYLDLVAAANAFTEAEYGGSTLDLGALGGKRPFYVTDSNFKTRSATCWCMVISIVIAVVLVGVAMLMSVWGLEVHAVPYMNVTAVAAYVDGVASATGNTTCVVAAQTEFDAAVFFGIPTANVLWNIYGGLVLGLVFGFLDNYGLFYGMSALDAAFYDFGGDVAAGVMVVCGRQDEQGITESKLLSDLHDVTVDLMSGLGNTFSDALGVALGTAALEIAKAGLNVEPTFWALDLLAIVIGCLLGCFMPVLMKHSEALGGNRNSLLLSGFSMANIYAVFLAVFLAGVPYTGAHVASVAVLGISIVLLAILLLAGICVGGNQRARWIEAAMQGTETGRASAASVARA